jgi:hypothetical protein
MSSNEAAKIDHEIVILIYLQEENKWAVYNKNTLEFPNISPLNRNFDGLTITELAVKYIKELLNVDLRTIKIDNIGFVDSIKELQCSDIYSKGHNISFGFFVQILPGTHINSELEFITYDEIRNAISRISENHFKLLRKSVGYISYVPIFTKQQNT